MDVKLRIESLDQLRGFAILSMVLVNVLGYYPIMPETFRHNLEDGFRFADFVAPLFVFLVGIGFRISFLKNQNSHGKWHAIKKSVHRFTILFIVSVFVYHFSLNRMFWDALTEIAIAGIFAIPVIGSAKQWPRILIAFAFLGLFPTARILGLQFEPFVWVFPLLIGSLVADWIDDRKKMILRTLIWGICLSLAGALIAIVVPNAIFITYIGCSFLITFCFYYIADVWKKPFPHLSTLGKNAIVVYILHYLIRNDLRSYIHSDAGYALALASFVIVYIGCYATAKYLERRNYFITI